MFRAVAAILCLSLTACVTDPAKFQFEKSRHFERPAGEVWGDLLAYLARSDFQVSTSERSSGVITAEKLISDDIDPAWSSRGRVEDLADCGKEFMETPGAQTVKLTVYISEKSGIVSGTVTTKFVETYKGTNTLYGYYEPRQPKQCNSTGRLEMLLLDAMSGKAG